MFTGETDDNRTRKQKKADKTAALPQQELMFSQRDILQIVNPRPKFDLSPTSRLVLIREDPRTPDEVEQDRLKKALDNTVRMDLGGSDA